MKARVLLMVALLLGSVGAAQAQGIYEGFDDVAALTGAGWILQNNSEPLGSTGWFQGDPSMFPAQGGLPTAYVAADAFNTGAMGAISNWLLTPPITLVDGAVFEFWTRRTNSPFSDRLQVRMSLAGNGADVGSTSLSVGTFTTLLLEIDPTLSGNYPTEWTEFTITVTGVPTPTLGRLAFRYFVEGGGVLGLHSDYIGIDTVAYSSTLVPAGLTVDAMGNQVLEPGDAGATMAPSWRNIDAGAIALTGTLSDFTGPQGASYAITDGVASYGLIAAGAEASCTSTADCYGVSVTAATRPVQHWDATAVEAVSVGNTTKTWTLHLGGSFTDVPSSSLFYRFVETIFHRRVTGGCLPNLYCPSQFTTREQMAIFVLRSKEASVFQYVPPACAAPNRFSDVPEGSPYCPYIEELANRGVVAGCGPDLYCPTDAVTREQIAVFVLRTLDPALDPPACGLPMFGDVPSSSPFCRWIEELARRGVVAGCGGGNYCPSDPVSREQMSVFLSVTFGLTL